MDFHKRRLIPCLTALVLAAGAASAQAATSDYPTNDGARTLDAGLAGYTSTTSSEGLCVPQLLCPVVTNNYKSTGGVDNTGYIETRLGSLTGVGSTSIGVWNSATFTYNGVDGKPADSLRVALARRSDVSALLQVAGNSATYSVDVIQVGGGGSVNAVSNQTLSGISSFSEKSFEIDADSLKVGSQYRIRITSRFTSGAQVLPGGSADYDNIRVEAQTNDTDDNGGGGGGGGGGGNGGNTNDRFNGNGVVSGAAILKGDRLIVRTKCKGTPKGRCLLNLQAKLKKRGPAVTNRRTVRVRAGHKRKAALDVKGKFLPELTARAASGKKIVIKQKLRKSGKVAKGYVKVKVKLAS